MIRMKMADELFSLTQNENGDDDEEDEMFGVIL
jgi:hypothetical protein